MDRLAIALNNVAREAARPRCFRAARRRHLPTADAGRHRADAATAEREPAARATGMTAQQPALSASMNSMAPMSAGGHAAMTAKRRGRHAGDA